MPSLNGCSPMRGQHSEACEKCRLSSPTQDLRSQICTRTRFPGDPWAWWRLATLSVASERGLTEPPVDVSPEDTCFYFIFPIQKAFKVWVASVEGPHFCLLCRFHAPPRLQPQENPGALLLPLPKVLLTASFHSSQWLGVSWCCHQVSQGGLPPAPPWTVIACLPGEPVLSSPCAVPGLSLSL